MSNIGIVRRIDNLGRIVIPMEIRRNLKIKEGDPLELNLLENKIIISKFSVFDNFGQKTIDFAESLQKALNINVIITDLDKVACATGEKKKEFEGEQCTKQLIKTLMSREITHRTENFIPIYLKDSIDYKEQLIVPIILDSEIYGSVICLSNKEISNEKIQVVKIFTDVIAKTIA